MSLPDRPATRSVSALKRRLNRLYSTFDFEGRLRQDPIEFPRRYTNRADIEVAAFIASSLAYGRVDLFKPVVGSILSRMGGSPCDALVNADRRDLIRFSSGLMYRFNSTGDITCLLHVVATVLRSYGSLEALFMQHFHPGDATTERAMNGFVRAVLAIDASVVYGKNLRPPGFLQFFPSPEKGSTCKRMCLFLRWVVRDRDIDLGIWKEIPKDRLVIPLDTHIARIARCIGLTQRKGMDWKMALDITASLRRLDPRDPLKYDFALCHQGIAGICRAAHCADCRIFG